MFRAGLGCDRLKISVGPGYDSECKKWASRGCDHESESPQLILSLASCWPTQHSPVDPPHPPPFSFHPSTVLLTRPRRIAPAGMALRWRGPRAAGLGSAGAHHVGATTGRHPGAVMLCQKPRPKPGRAAENSRGGWLSPPCLPQITSWLGFYSACVLPPLFLRALSRLVPPSLLGQRRFPRGAK